MTVAEKTSILLEAYANGLISSEKLVLLLEALEKSKSRYVKRGGNI